MFTVFGSEKTCKFLENSIVDDVFQVQREQLRASSNRIRIDLLHKVDMISYRRIRLQARGGLFSVILDGQTVASRALYNDFPLQGTWFGHLVGAMGDSLWRDVVYSVTNQSEPNRHWHAVQGQYPDQYQIDHVLELHANPPGPDYQPDNGYFSWVELSDGLIFIVDYTNRGDAVPTSHLYGVCFSLPDFEVR